MSVILLTDILNLRARKAKELVYYTERKARLESKLFFLRAEIRLTEIGRAHV